jgi:hypothetical protein
MTRTNDAPWWSRPACCECGSRRDDGENIDYEDPTSESGVSRRFVCAPCLDHWAALANEAEAVADYRADFDTRDREGRDEPPCPRCHGEGVIGAALPLPCPECA